MSEKKTTEEVLLEASNSGARLFRQNVGMGWAGKVVGRRGNLMTIRDPRPLRAGLTVGSSDIVGITPVEITEDMVGQTIGVFTAVEVKYGRTATTEQQIRFLGMVEKLGGISLRVKTLKEYVSGVSDWMKKKTHRSQ